MKKIGEFALAKGEETKVAVAEHFEKKVDEKFNQAWNAPLPEAAEKFAALGIKLTLTFTYLEKRY